MSKQKRRNKIGSLKKHRENVIEFKKKVCNKYPEYKLGMCLAKLKNPSGDGHSFCKRLAIKGTLRCRRHGGLRAGRPVTTGRYSKDFTGTLGERYEEFRNDPKLLDLTDELASFRALFSEFKGRGDELMDIGVDEDGKLVIKTVIIKNLQELLKNISVTVERIHKIQSGYFSPETLPIIINQIVSISGGLLTRCPHCGKSLAEVGTRLFNALQKIRVPGAESLKLPTMPSQKILKG